MTFLTDIARAFFAFLDCSIYTLINWAYQLLMYLANLDLFGMTFTEVIGGQETHVTSTIEVFAGRVYSLLAVFMLFRIAFSLLQYLVDPNKFYDEKKGASSIVKHVIISLLLIVTVPMIFQKAFDVQQIILNSGVIGELILGDVNYGTDKKPDTTSASGENATAANNMQFLVLGTFMSIDPSVITSCENGPVLGTVAMATAVNADGTYCVDEVSKVLDDNGLKITDFFYTDSGTDNRNVWDFSQLINVKSNGKYIIDYKMLVSTVVGGFIVILLIRFCLDIAVRIVKLGFLEIIAPIPIVAYMGPSDKESSMLSRWGKECLSTYLALFVRLAILFFAFYVIDVITDAFCATSSDMKQYYMNGDAPVGIMGMFVVVMVILGTLIFANQLPKLISKIFGTSGEDALGGIGFSPKKAIDSSPLAKATVGGVTGLATGLGIGALGTATGAGKGRFFTAAMSGMKAGIGGKSANDIRKMTVDGNRDLRNAISNGSTLTGRIRSRATNFLGIQGALGKVEDEKRVQENIVHDLEGQKYNLQQEMKPYKERFEARNNVISALTEIKDRAYEKAKEDNTYQDYMAQIASAEQQAKNATDPAEQQRQFRAIADLKKQAEDYARGAGSIAWLNQNRNDAKIVASFAKYNNAKTIAAGRGIRVNDGNDGVTDFAQANLNALFNKDNVETELTNRNTEDWSTGVAPRENRITELDEEISFHQHVMSNIDETHKEVGSDYTGGRQSGGTTIRNTTERPDAGQHPGNHNSPIGPGPGGHGQGGFGPGPHNH